MDPNLIGSALLPGLDVIGAAERLKRRRNLIYGGIIAGILILAGGGYALYRRHKSKGASRSESRKANRAKRAVKRRGRRRKNKSNKPLPPAFVANIKRKKTAEVKAKEAA